MGDKAREVWRRSHGYTKATLEQFLKDEDWVLDDPRFRALDFEVPQSVQTIWKAVNLLEGEIIRLMSAGPPYVPHGELDGSFVVAHIHAFFPQPWVEFMKRMGMPDTLLTDDLVEGWAPSMEEGLTFANGNLFSTHPWALNDPAWSLLVASYIPLLLDPSISATFGTTPARIKVTDGDSLSLAIIGDWGSGSYGDGAGQLSPPQAIMEQVEALGVDYTIHLGDIYPVGRGPFYDSFLADWRPGRLGSFNLNSNHDMFGWGKGYFEAGLRHESFAAQLGTSYFSVEFGDWILIGLDSAYHDTSPLYDAGTVSDPDQTAFLREIREQVDRTGQKTFVMCHHNGLNLAGTEATKVWNDIVAEDALGKAPDVWYYGHQHIGVVYSTGSAAGPDPLIRCIGHSSLPFAVPSGLEEHVGPGKPIAGFSRTPYGDDTPEHRRRAMNGFAVVTLTKDGGMTERFLNQDGSEWHS